MSPTAYVQPLVKSTSVFKNDIFKGKVLFCTGGGSGICRGMTEAMMTHGADAVIVGRNAERLQTAAAELSKSTGRTCIAASADVRQPKALQEAVAKAIEKFGRIDYVICGAAGNFLAPISGMSENAFKTVIEIDTIGTYNTIKATLPHLRKSKGSYLLVSAMLHYRGTAYQVHVSAAKAAVDAISRVLAVEEGPHGIRSNVLAPGPIEATEGMNRLLMKGMENFKSSIPAGRVGTIQDCANATVYLFSDAAAFITGQIIAVDGGDFHVSRGLTVAYPDVVLKPEAFSHLFKGKL